MEYDLQRATKQFEKLIKKLNETHEQTKMGVMPVVESAAGTSNVTGEKTLVPVKDATVCHVKVIVSC